MTQTTEITPEAPEQEKIWAHSGDSHAMEPADLWTSRLPKRLADRVRVPSGARSTKSSTSTVSS